MFLELAALNTLRSEFGRVHLDSNCRVCMAHSRPVVTSSAPFYNVAVTAEPSHLAYSRAVQMPDLKAQPVSCRLRETASERGTAIIKYVTW